MPGSSSHNADLDDTADDLYSVDPSEFVAARKTAAASARKSGNRALATAIEKLRKPTIVGWLVNVLVRAEPEDIAEFFDLGDSLRDAQRRSSAKELKELSTRRQQSIRALTSRAVDIAKENGKTVADDVARDVGQTLGAALADPEIGERVRAGRVVTAETYSGFGPAVLAVVPEPPAQDTEEPDTAEPDDAEPDDAVQEELDRAREELDEARDDEEAARAAAEVAESESENAQQRVSEAKERLERLRAELHEAEETEAQARASEKSAAREERRLRRVYADSQARTAELQEALKQLEGPM